MKKEEENDCRCKTQSKSGKEEEIEKILTDMVGKVDQEEGTLAYTLHRSRKDPSVFLFYEKYKDKDALSFHSSTPYFKEMFSAIDPLLDGNPEINMYNEIAGLNRP